MKDGGWIVVLAVAAVLAVIAAAAVQTEIRADGAQGRDKFVVEHYVIKLWVAVIAGHMARPTTDAKILREYVLEEVEAEVEDILALRQTILQIVSEQHPVVGDRVVEHLRGVQWRVDHAVRPQAYAQQRDE